MIDRVETDIEAIETDVKEIAEQLFAQQPDWVTFYREVFGLRGVVRQAFPAREALDAFEQTETYQSILQMLTDLRQQSQLGGNREKKETTRVITVRLPKSMHDALKAEAHEHKTTMNKLCIAKLLQYIDGQSIRVET